MRRTLALLCLLSVAAWGAACSSDNANDNSNARSTNDGNATRNAAIETNANIPKNMNANSAPSNVGVLMNDNGNKNTEGVTSMNDNKNHNANGNKNHNANHGSNRNANH
jgi:hypothetical protein